MKKLLLLGGANVLIPVIKCAQEMGIYVITCDYLPNNKAHKYSNEYINVSVVDKEAVLTIAQKLQIDGIMSFACDAGVVTAAYVAEKMGLPFQCSLESAEILQNKGLFREFLTANGFNSPWAKKYRSVEAVLKEKENLKWPVIVKPVDSAGSKCVTKLDSEYGMREAIQNAIDGSRCRECIIEEFLQFEGFHSSTDMFSENGKLVFSEFSDQLFDENALNPFVPAYIIWPSTMKDKYQKELRRELQRLFDLLHMKTGIYNIETCVANGKPYIMEISPRGGGCKIAEMQKNIYGVDLIANEIRKSVNLPLESFNRKKENGCWCELVVHARENQYGKLKRIEIDSDIREKYIQLEALSVEEGDYVEPFSGGNMALGDLFLKFNDRYELDTVMKKVKNWLRVKIEEEK